MTVLRAAGTEIAIHAMRMRPRYRPVLIDFALVAYGFAGVVAREAARRARSTAMPIAIATMAIVPSSP